MTPNVRLASRVLFLMCSRIGPCSRLTFVGGSGSCGETTASYGWTHRDIWSGSKDQRLHSTIGLVPLLACATAGLVGWIKSVLETFSLPNYSDTLK